MKTFSNLKIASKMYLLIFLSIACIVSVVGISQLQLNKVFESGSVAMDNTVPSFNTLYHARVDFSRLQTLALLHVLNTDDVAMVALESEIQQLRSSVDRAFDTYDAQLVADDEDRRLSRLVAKAVKEYYSGMDIALMLSRKSGTTVSVEARQVLEKQSPLIAQINAAFDAVIDYNYKLAKAGKQEALDTRQTALSTLVLVSFGFLVLLGGVGWWIARRQLARPIGMVVDALKQLASGKLDVVINGVERSDEVGDVARAALVFKEFVLRLDAQSWVTSNVAKIGAVLQQAQDFRTLAQGAVSHIAPLIGAGHGAFYVGDTQGQFSLLASYGYRERKHLSNSFRIGEGLVGQCAMEKAPIMLTAPQNYIRINSGLGEGPPACVSVLPVIHNDRVLGVLEMASFQIFSERENALLDALLPTLATSMEIMDRNLRTQELLTATQEQAERMEKQAAQLEEQTVEMEAQQAELRETEGWFRSIIETAPDGMLVLDATGRIMLCNPNAEQLFGYSAGELVGSSFSHIVPAPDLSGAQHMAVQAAAGLHKAGHTLTITMSASPLPDLGGRGRCTSVSVRATDS